MKRVTALVVGAVLVTAVAFFAGSRWERRVEQAPTTGDSVWYHASDVARLASTGRPQLVEFFHPG